MTGIISVDQLSTAISEELENYNRSVIRGTKDEAKKAMDRLVRETKANAPARRPRYKNSITSRKEWESALGIGYIWYVKGSEYRLSHLLENGHATRNGGRTRAYRFIKNASDPILDDYVTAVEEVCKNG